MPRETGRRAPSPAARARARRRIRRLTGSSVFLAGGVTVWMGVTVAHEHPGSSAGANVTTTTALPTSSTTSSSTTTSTTAAGHNDVHDGPGVWGLHAVVDDLHDDTASDNHHDDAAHHHDDAPGDHVGRVLPPLRSVFGGSSGTDGPCSAKRASCTSPVSRQ